MTDTIVWITGGSSGIGAALAASVPFDHARVIDISRSGGASGTEHLPADLADPSTWAAVEAHLHTQLGGFTGSRAVFIHCAATLNPIGFAGEVESLAYQHSVLLNSAAPQVLGQAFLRASAGLECARYLLLISSGVAKTPYEGWSSYCAGKAALDQWVLVAGAEQRRLPNCCFIFSINPGAVATRVQEQIREVDERNFPAVEKFRELYTSGRLRSPKETAQGIWGLIDDRDLKSGALVDLRKRS